LKNQPHWICMILLLVTISPDLIKLMKSGPDLQLTSTELNLIE